MRKSFFQLHCRFSACCDSESNHSVLGHRKNVAKSCMGWTRWLVGCALTRMKLGKNHRHPATNVSVSSVVLVLPMAAIFFCRFAARTSDVTQLRGRVVAMRWTTFAMTLTSHRCATGQSNSHKESSHWIAFFLQVCLKDHRIHLQKILYYYNIQIQTLPEVRKFSSSLAATLSHMAWYGLFL